jgi:formiminotetrahydrofolate cyclodeaminase
MESLNVKEFIKQTCSNSPTPGGGSVAALLASLSTSLAAMSANLTINKKGYESVQDEMINLAKLFENKADLYLDYINQDIYAFNEVMASYKLKKDTLEEKEYRSKVIQEKLYNAMQVPFSLALDIYAILDDIRWCYYNSNKNIQSDALMAMIMARGTILSCVCNVGMNLKSIKTNIDKDSIQTKCIEMKNKAFEYEKELINDSQYISF